MKIIYSFIFFYLLIHTLCISSNVIYDSSGNKLLRGVPYYIIPLLRGSGGGLTLTQTTKNTCSPLNVTQEPFQVNHGVPYIFNPIILDEDIIRGAYPISIQANVISPNPGYCSGSYIWKVTSANVAILDDEHDHGPIKSSNHNKDNKKKHDDDDDDDDDDDKKFVTIQIVTTDGEFNKPESCFQFVENDMMPGLQSYQIQHCPFKCGSSSTNDFGCFNVGIISNADGNGYLGHTDSVFPIVFINSFGMFSSQPGKLATFSRLPAKVSTLSQLEK